MESRLCLLFVIFTELEMLVSFAFKCLMEYKLIAVNHFIIVLDCVIDIRIPIVKLVHDVRYVHLGWVRLDLLSKFS